MAIVCATDLSERSRPALRSAAAFAARTGDELCLVHVLELPAAALDVASRAALEAAAAHRLAEEKALLGPGASAARTVVLAGAAAGALASFCADNAARLLVVASQGQGSSPLLRLGGTSERVALVADTPLLVVRDSAPFEAWARGDRPLRIVLGVDFTASSEPPIRWARALRQAGPCDVVLGHVYWAGLSDPASRRYRPAPGELATDADAQAAQWLKRDLSARVGDLGGEGAVSVRLALGLGRVGDHLLALAEAEKADVVVVGTHRQAGFGRLSSVASVVLHYSHSSVVVVPSPRGEVLVPDEVPRIRRVLVASDLSAEATYAIPFAYSLVAGEGEGEVVLLHVAAEDKGPPEADLVASLRRAVPSRGVRPEITTRVEILRQSNEARAILQAAARLGVDVICLGCRARSGLVRSLLGSVAETILKESRVPVFVVHPPPR